MSNGKRDISAKQRDTETGHFLARAHAPSGEGKECPNVPLSRDRGTKPSGTRDILAGQDTTAPRAYASLPASRPSPAPKTDFEAECKAIAKRVLLERDQGWPVDEQRIRWAELTLSGKQLVLVWTAREEAVLVERAGISAPGMYRYVDGELVELPTTRARLSDH